MREGVQLKYGWISGGKSSVPVPMLASQVMKAQSGRFINITTAGYGEVFDDSDTAEIFGFAEGPEETTSTTNGGTVYNVIVDLTAVFRIPVVDTGSAGEYAITMFGDTCDIGVLADVQGAELVASTVTGQLLIVGGDSTYYVDVMINPAKKGLTAVV